MTIPEHILFEVGNTVTLHVPVRPAATQTVSCYTGLGAAVFETKTATLEAINTTLSAAVTRGATTITVAAGTNIARGSILWLTAFEQVLVHSIASTTVTLRRPILNNHAESAAVQSNKLTYAVPAASATPLFWDGRLEWLIDDTAGTETLYHQPCICTKYRFYRHAQETDWLDEEPKVYDLLDAEVDADRALDIAFDHVVKRIAAVTQGRAWAYIGPQSFKQATIFAAQRNLYRRQPGDEAEVLYLRYQKELADELERVTAGTAWRDADQDGVVEEHEQVRIRSVRMTRG